MHSTRRILPSSRSLLAVILSSRPVPTHSFSNVAGRVEIREDGRVFVKGKPLRLSPSAVSTWRQCPLLFKRRYIERVPEPPTEASARGTLVHKSLERLFDYEPTSRTLETLQNDFRAEWREARKTERYRPLFFPEAPKERTADDVSRERAWGLEAFKAFERYLELEDPTTLAPEKREEHICHTLDPALGLEVNGIIDRIDASSFADGGLVITDYKTGRSPSAKYSPAVNARIKAEAFFQLQVYALLLQLDGRPAREMRLMYLGDGKMLTEEVTPAAMDHATTVLRETWQQVLAALREDASSGPDAFPTLTGPLCSWCAHQSACPAMQSDGEGRQSKRR